MECPGEGLEDVLDFWLFFSHVNPKTHLRIPSEAELFRYFGSQETFEDLYPNGLLVTNAQERWNFLQHHYAVLAHAHEISQNVSGLLRELQEEFEVHPQVIVGQHVQGCFPCQSRYSVFLSEQSQICRETKAIDENGLYKDSFVTLNGRLLNLPGFDSVD